MDGYVPMDGVLWLGGVIIEILGEEAVMHHGGFADWDEKLVYDPVPIPWSTHNGVMTFDLSGWWCRPLEVIEGERRHMLLTLDTCCYVRGGTLSVTPSPAAQL